MEKKAPNTGASNSGHRATQRALDFSGIVIVLIALVAGVALLVNGPEPYIPSSLWLALLFICLGADFLPIRSHRLQLAVYLVTVVLSWVLVATVPDMGSLLVLLILVAVTGVGTVPMWTIIGIIVANCVIVIVHMWAHGAEPAQYLVAAGFSFGLHCAIVFIAYALVRETRLRGRLEEKTTELEAASVLLENSAKTAERLRISRELHDLIGHQLTILNLELEAAKHRGATAARSHIDQAADVAKALLADVRSTVGELRTTGPTNLRDALERLASAVRSLDITVEVNDHVVVDEQQAEALIRAAQEIITNAVKHSEAKELWLTVATDDSGVTLTGANDGIAPRSVVAGHGLHGLRERVELLGGGLTVTPYPSFTVEVQLPQYDARQVQR